MSKHHKQYGPSKTRVVTYEVHGPWKEDPESLLKKAVADGIITMYDDGRGDFCWFQGPPGEPMRSLRDTVQSMSNHDPNNCEMCDLIAKFPSGRKYSRKRNG
jgi:hypothetical protein